MGSHELTPLQRLKISCFSRGLRIDKAAENHLTQGGNVPLSIHEYATTGGVTLEFEGGIYVNAPFDDWFCDSPEVTLSVDEATGRLVASFMGALFPVHVLPLPGYLETRDGEGRLVRDTVMSHADRARLSPVYGCTFSCQFCDFAGKKYVRRPVEQLLAALAVARQDALLPVSHVMVSGGTPGPRDYGYFDEVCEKVVRSMDMPVDVMMVPRMDVGIIDSLADWGIHGYALNMEVYDDEVARRVIPQKRRLGLSQLAASIERAPSLPI